MRLMSLLCGSLAIFGSVGVASAQSVVQSKLTVDLKMDVTVPAGSSNNASQGTAVRTVTFKTKDLLDLVSAASGRNDLKQAVMIRETDPADSNPPLVFLNQKVFFLNGDGAVVPTNDVFTQTPISTTGLLSATSTEVKVKNNEVQSRTDSGLEGTNWSIQGSGGAGDVNLSLVGLDTLKLKQLTSGGVNQGLIYTSRVSDVNGGGDFGLTSGTVVSVSGDGVVTGTVKAAKEKATNVDVAVIGENRVTGVRPGQPSTGSRTRTGVDDDGGDDPADPQAPTSGN